MTSTRLIGDTNGSGPPRVLIISHYAARFPSVSRGRRRRRSVQNHDPLRIRCRYAEATKKNLASSSSSSGGTLSRNQSRLASTAEIKARLAPYSAECYHYPAAKKLFLSKDKLHIYTYKISIDVRELINRLLSYTSQLDLTSGADDQSYPQRKSPPPSVALATMKVGDCALQNPPETRIYA